MDLYRWVIAENVCVSQFYSNNVKGICSLLAILK
uniref:Uncharacterized protein n=1 Tax=Anguilla anguilla TaxID=7936 RepID=A0A0E9TL26_ANGAN